MVECTVDLCNANGAQWAHIPDHNRCDPGQACDPTAGCVAGGVLSGNATLLGHTDHSGITVTVEGVEGATATTDAMGNWSIIIGAGTYRVTYSKDKYITQTSPDVVVVPEASDGAPPVELSHSERVGPDHVFTPFYGYDSFLNADKTFLIEYVQGAFGTTYYATAMDGSTGPVHLVTNPSNIRFTGTHAVWNEGNIVYSRPLTGASAPVNLSSTITGGSISVFGTPGAYTVIRRVRQLPTFNESSLYVAKTDGSSLAGPAIWTQPDNAHTLGSYAGNDSFGLFTVSNNSNPSGPPGDAVATTPIYRVDFAAGTATAVDIGFATNDLSFFSVSPDQSRVYGYVRQFTGTRHWYRGFIADIAAGAPRLAANYGTAGTTQTIFHDYPSNTDGWLADGTLIFRTTYWHNGSAYQGGELKIWPPTGDAITLSGTNQTYPYYIQFSPLYVLNGAIAWREYPINYIRVVGMADAATIYNLDTTGLASGVWTKVGTGTGGSYIAWTQVPSGTNLPNKVFGANIPTTVASQPPTVQLGPNVPATCSFEGTLSGTTFFQLCSETGTLTAYAAASNTPAGTASGVHGSLFTMPDADRIAFRKTDGNVYTASNAGTLADVTPLATKADGNAPIKAVGTWVLYRDAEQQLTRVSKADGSVIDEPLSDCDMAGSGDLYLNEAGTHLFGSFARCGDFDTMNLVHAPTANLP